MTASPPGHPVPVHTSLTVRGEPVVHADAIRMIQRPHTDALAVGPFVLASGTLPDAERRLFAAEQIAPSYGLDWPAYWPGLEGVRNPCVADLSAIEEVC